MTRQESEIHECVDYLLYRGSCFLFHFLILFLYSWQTISIQANHKFPIFMLMLHLVVHVFQLRLVTTRVWNSFFCNAHLSDFFILTYAYFDGDDLIASVWRREHVWIVRRRLVMLHTRFF